MGERLSAMNLLVAAVQLKGKPIIQTQACSVVVLNIRMLIQALVAQMKWDNQR